MDVYNPQEYLAWREDVQESIFEDHKPGEFSDPNNLPAGVTWKTGSLIVPLPATTPMTGSSAWNCSNRSLTTILPEEHSTGMMEEHSTGMMKHIRKHSDKIIMSTFQEKKDKVSYYWSLGYLNNEGIVIGDKYKSYRSRLKLDFDVTSWLSAGVNVQYSYRDQGSYPTQCEPDMGKYSLFHSDRSGR